MKDSTPDIIIVRGAPGSGKSQTAKKLSKYYLKGVRMEVDAIRQMVISVQWTDQQEHISMLRVAANLAFNFLALHYRPVIVVDTFSGDKASEFLKDLTERNDALKVRVISLHTTGEELCQRLDQRPEGQFKDVSISQKLNADILRYSIEGEMLIDTTGADVQATADMIYNNLK